MANETSVMAARLRQIEESARAAFADREQRLLAELEAESAPESRRGLVPVPRRGRVFLRHGEGPGVFSDLTLTSPVRRREVAPA